MRGRGRGAAGWVLPGLSLTAHTQRPRGPGDQAPGSPACGLAKSCTSQVGPEVSCFPSRAGASSSLGGGSAGAPVTPTTHPHPVLGLCPSSAVLGGRAWDRALGPQWQGPGSCSPQVWRAWWRPHLHRHEKWLLQTLRSLEHLPASGGLTGWAELGSCEPQGSVPGLGVQGWSLLVCGCLCSHKLSQKLLGAASPSDTQPPPKALGACSQPTRAGLRL